jgi:hypothetical protein
VANSTYPVLCGGTFFTLILEARGQRTSQRSRYEGEQDGLSQPDTLAGLGKVVYPEYDAPKNKRTFTTNANAYKSCADDGSNLTFLFPDAKTAFDNRVKTEYPKALKSMCDFTEQFLEVGTSIKKEAWLVKSMLELIENDQSIDDDQEFFICNGGKGVTKATIRLMSDFAIQTLLLGVWHFVVVNRPNNKLGKDTFDNWCPPRDRAERKYEGTMGIGIQREINVEVLYVPAEETTVEAEIAATAESTQPSVDTDPKRITVNNYGTVQNQKFISIETMNGDIHL